MDELLVDTAVFIDHLRAFRRIDPGGDRLAQLALPDALIAATALERDLELLTHNVGHFQRVNGLLLRSPA